MDLNQFRTLFTKQNQLLFGRQFLNLINDIVTLSLLLNLAEDLSIEVKMVKRDILKYLLEILSRKSAAPAVSNGTCSDLVLHTVLLFLSKLGIFQENKDILITVHVDFPFFFLIGCIYVGWKRISSRIIKSN